MFHGVVELEIAPCVVVMVVVKLAVLHVIWIYTLFALRQWFAYFRLFV
jgi:hypothetical protein